MKFGALLGTTCITSLAVLMISTPAVADTTVSSDSTTPLSTSTAGNITIADDAELSVGTGAVITVDSNNNVTISDDGAITAGKVNGATGILVQSGVTTTVTNNGTITVTEDFIPTDADDNSIADGAIASKSDRYGIHLVGVGTVTGTITNTGTINVEGLNSGGIVSDATLDGSLVQDGTIRVIGDYSVGVRTGDVTGDIVMEGSTVVTGKGAKALAVDGDVGGTIRIQGSVGQTASFTNDDGETVNLSRFDLRLGTAAVEILGNVDGGIVVAARPAENDSNDADEDDDGVTDSEEGTGTIASVGNGPAMQIGGTTDITVGALSAANGGYSLLVQGTVSGTASYSGTDAYGIVFGGAGGAVNLPGGIGVAGTVTATTQDSTATAILINEGVTASSMYVGGSISARISSQGEGAAYAIRDLSGTLTTIENTGYISAIGSSTDIAHAIDLSTTTADVTITQYMSAADYEAREDIEADLDEGETDSTVYTSIHGDILTGSGNDTLAANAGQIVGNTYFNAGNDQLLLSGESYFSGKVFFGEGNALAALSDDAQFYGTIDFANLAGSLTIADNAVFLGTVANGAASSVTVTGGTFGADEVETISVNSLTVGSGGTINAFINGETGTSSLIVANTAVFESGAKVSTTIDSLEGIDGTYTILTAGTIEGNPTFDNASAVLPYIFSGSVSVVGNELTLDIHRKTAAETGLKAAAASGYEAVLAAAVNDDVISQSFLDITDRETLQTQVDQMLPDYAGGIFDSVTRSSRLVAKHIMDNDANFELTDVGGMAGWFEPVLWRGNRNATDTSSPYKSSGWGLTGGVEWLTDIGYIGGSYAWLSGSVDNNGGTGKIDTSENEFAAFWRMSQTGPFYAFARVSAARTSFSSKRTISVTADDTSSTYSTEGDWDGWLFSGMGGASYEFVPMKQFTIRPKAVLEWYRLKEDGYTESGGGEAIDLTVESRMSTSLSGTATLALSYAFGPPQRDAIPLTVEFEAGRRTILSGDLGTTRASFEDGDTFSIIPDSLDNSWVSELSVYAGGWDYTWKVAGGMEKTANSDPAYSGRVSLSVAF